jgi:prephenate dehydrogenase
MQRVTIVGIGLIGGSFALALRQAGFQGRIIGVSSPRTIEEALRLGVIDEALPLELAAPTSDLVYLAQPISGILDTIARLDVHVKPGALITDAGSTKVRIVEQATLHIRRAHFLGGHPMAGKEVRGVAAAEPGLFQDRTYVLTPTGELPDAASEFTEWIRRIGARPLFLRPEEHDRVVAFVSHLPQLVSTTLAAMLGGRHDLPAVEQAAGPGLMDDTRLALSSFEIWRDILATNPAYVSDALLAYIEALRQMHGQLAKGDVTSLFEAGSEFAARLRRK